MHSEVSSSQVNFFKMLDEKIENVIKFQMLTCLLIGTLFLHHIFQGIELEEAEEDEEHERQTKLQRVGEEWDNLLGRSQDGGGHLLLMQDSEDSSTHRPKSDIPNKGISKTSGNNDKLAAIDNNVAGSSVDSMRTMFSNSLTMPTGTFREAVAATNNEVGDILELNSKRKSSSTSLEGRPASAIGGRTRSST